MLVLGPNQEIKYHPMKGCGSSRMRELFQALYAANKDNYDILPTEICIVRDPWKRFLCLLSYKRYNFEIDFNDYFYVPSFLQLQYLPDWHNDNITYFKYNKQVLSQICLLFREKNVIIRDELWPTDIVHVNKLNNETIKHYNSVKHELIEKHLQKDIDFYNSLSYYNV